MSSSLTSIAVPSRCWLFRATPLHLLLPYWTAEIGAGGQIHFYDDVYQRDQKILTALDSPYRVNIPEY